MEYRHIDINNIFDNENQLVDFKVMQSYNVTYDYRIEQTNFLLVTLFENAFEFVDDSLFEKLNFLKEHANSTRNSDLLVMIELIEKGKLAPKNISDDLDNQTLYNRLSNIAGGFINDFSILHEINKIYVICELENLIVDNRDAGLER